MECTAVVPRGLPHGCRCSNDNEKRRCTCRHAVGEDCVQHRGVALCHAPQHLFAMARHDISRRTSDPWHLLAQCTAYESPNGRAEGIPAEQAVVSPSRPAARQSGYLRRCRASSGDGAAGTAQSPLPRLPLHPARLGLTAKQIGCCAVDCCMGMLASSLFAMASGDADTRSRTGAAGKPSMMKPQNRSVRSRRILSANHPAGMPDAAQNVPKMPSAIPTDCAVSISLR